ncbi:TetR/AcrR family transcriptional regulator [Pyxidicoccus xibeiensis]|uniref:TetR/AcrR family transcriptional regulator n=1 Tax=Pyxidicoccus xibeiensis TaxID=2906759 RepID=UPI0020A7E458|nr:TetR/AcrR family transcriptional regulator [Pyxidicoccus xibeiensis]MCP3141722.1 TetR/AcrR family transcriptional regulator [Pyxidicoccus xibeiensis]
MAQEAPHESKVRLLDAALHVIRARGYAATRIDDVCAEAGLTKGSFFHHFDSKEDLALAAVEHFGAMADALFEAAPSHRAEDPLERVLGYVDFRIAMLQGALPEFTCLHGTLVQETYDTHPALREACNRYMSAHSARVAQDLAEAKRRHTPAATWSPDGLALHIQAVLQGAFILAKARQGPEVAADCLRHLRRYLELLFTHPQPEEKPA